MSLQNQKIIEHVFFFGILSITLYLVWLLFEPFTGAIALSIILVTVCLPVHEKILAKIPNRKSLAALLSVLFVIAVVVTPLALLTSFVFKEALSIYAIFNSVDQVVFVETLSKIELFVQKIIPNFSLNIASVIEQGAHFVVTHFISIFTGTASTIFNFFIAVIAGFYLFRDGKYFTRYIIQLSPLRDSYDEKILARLAVAVRSVATSTLFVALVQGVLTAIGLSLFGFERAILWGCLAAIGALIPGIGTSVVFIPSVIYLVLLGSHVAAILCALWGVIAVGLIDNVLGPYVMSRNNNVHPFLILLSVLGGIIFFGPIGFILGPVTLSLFLVLLEIYHTHIKDEDV